MSRFKPPLVLVAVALLTACKPASDKVFGERVRAYLVAHPEVMLEVQDALDKKQLAQAQADSAKAVARIKAALPTYRAAIERDPMDYVANPNGKVTVTEFFDFRCGHCRNMMPQVIQLIAANPDVRFVFKDYPIFGPTSDQAAALALAAKPDNKYLSLYKDFFEAQELSPAALQQIAASEGLDYGKLVERATDPALVKHIQANQKLAHDIGIDGTPHFIVGDQVIAGEFPDQLKAAIAKARKSA